MALVALAVGAARLSWFLNSDEPTDDWARVVYGFGARRLGVALWIGMGMVRPLIGAWDRGEPLLSPPVAKSLITGALLWGILSPWIGRWVGRRLALLLGLRPRVTIGGEPCSMQRAFRALQSGITVARVRWHIDAPSSAVYRALLAERGLAMWQHDATRNVHELDAHAGGGFRISLTYDVIGPKGGRCIRTDTYRGRFTQLVPEWRICQVVWLEATDTEPEREMTVVCTLIDTSGGTDVLVEHSGLSPLRVELTEISWRISLHELAEDLTRKAAA